MLPVHYTTARADERVVQAVGGVAERARLLPVLVVSFLWATIVYNPVACWTWNPTGWGYINGVLDVGLLAASTNFDGTDLRPPSQFAGGGPVHITSGTASLVWSFYLGRRRGYGTAKLAYRPHSVSHVILGTTLIWFGWFGFNGGSEVAMNLRSVQASIVTNVAAAMGGMTWMIMDLCVLLFPAFLLAGYIDRTLRYRSIYTRKWSAVSLCSGILAGLVGEFAPGPSRFALRSHTLWTGITPAAGFVGTPASLAIGAVAAIAANFATGLKVLLKIDDAVDGFALHAVGGYVGSVLTGLFADSRVVEFDGYTAIPGGWINHHYVQLGWQLASATSILAYTAVMTYILIFIVDHIPGFKVRCSEDDEIIGMDESQTGEVSPLSLPLR